MPTFRWTILVAAVLATTRAEAVVVYQNDFNAQTSLNGFTFGATAGGQPPTSVDLTSGQLRIVLGTGLPNGGYAAVQASAYGTPYSPVLASNPGLVSWAFNLSNQDGAFNNEFAVALASTAADARVFTSSSYVFAGGGYVGNRMGLWRQLGQAQGGPTYQPIIDITNGLGPLPQKGSFRITYDPASQGWKLYGVMGTSYVDPLTVTTLLGSVTDSRLTGIALPYTSFIGGTTGFDYFDNYTVSVVPEPAASLLLAMGAAAFSGMRRRP